MPARLLLGCKLTYRLAPYGCVVCTHSCLSHRYALSTCLSLYNKKLVGKNNGIFGKGAFPGRLLAFVTYRLHCSLAGSLLSCVAGLAAYEIYSWVCAHPAVVLRAAPLLMSGIQFMLQYGIAKIIFKTKLAERTAKPIAWDDYLKIGMGWG